MHFTPAQFTKKLLAWYQNQGRANLPWREGISPYRVWVSEIMLQQTQVITVIPYFQRFIARFPTIEDLAQATLDEVLSYWAGLGYYSRGRNLHRTAQILWKDYQGIFPDELAELVKLPGIGRSTAGAILSIAFQKAVPILDGNVKRILTRLFLIEGWPDAPKVNQLLWEIAATLTPKKNPNHYAQAIMDLGATLCTRSKPACTSCPVQSYCHAYQKNQTAQFPQRKVSKVLPIKQVRLLIIKNIHGQIFLEKRPLLGIWGGLWTLPECALDVEIKKWCLQQLNCRIKLTQEGKTFRHTFSHFHLDITPVEVQLLQQNRMICESSHQIWYDHTIADEIGVPAPIKKILRQAL